MLIVSKAATPPNRARTAPDGLSTLALVVGWALIIVGLLFWVLAITN